MLPHPVQDKGINRISAPWVINRIRQVGTLPWLECPVVRLCPPRQRRFRRGDAGSVLDPEPQCRQFSIRKSVSINRHFSQLRSSFQSDDHQAFIRLTRDDRRAPVTAAMYSAGKPAHEACREIVVRSALLWKVNEGDYRDDITCIVVYVPELLRMLSAAAVAQD